MNKDTNNQDTIIQLRIDAQKIIMGAAIEKKDFTLKKSIRKNKFLKWWRNK